MCALPPMPCVNSVSCRGRANVAQVRRVIAETVARQRSGVISADKLPPECRSLAKRKLTQMEALERDAIVRSLEASANNKLQVGNSLGDVAGDDLSQDEGLRHRLIRQRSVQGAGARAAASLFAKGFPGFGLTEG